MTQMDYICATKYFILQDFWRVSLPLSLASFVPVSFLAKYEVLGGFLAVGA